MTKYCENDPCCTEATDIVLFQDGRKKPLCYTCREAFESGTMYGHERVEFYPIEDWDEIGETNGKKEKS